MLLEILRKQLPVPHEYGAHKMKGDWAGWWDCHLAGNFVLIWRYVEDAKGTHVLLGRVGTHQYLKIA